MKLLDLYCGQGGAARGYHDAGFTDITGIDIAPQPRYPYTFIQADALEYLASHGKEYDMIHASPACQGYSVTKSIHGKTYPMQIPELRATLQLTSKPYIIENVPGAPLENFIMLCGTMFGLKIFRHRLFETNPPLILSLTHEKHGKKRIGENGFVCVAGHGDSGNGRVPANHRTAAAWKSGIGIDWMTMAGLSQAIPPAYTQWIGTRMKELITMPGYTVHRYGHGAAVPSLPFRVFRVFRG